MMRSAIEPWSQIARLHDYEDLSGKSGVWIATAHSKQGKVYGTISGGMDLSAFGHDWAASNITDVVENLFKTAHKYGGDTVWLRRS